MSQAQGILDFKGATERSTPRTSQKSAKKEFVRTFFSFLFVLNLLLGHLVPYDADGRRRAKHVHMAHGTSVTQSVGVSSRHESRDKPGTSKSLRRRRASTARTCANGSAHHTQAFVRHLARCGDTRGVTLENVCGRVVFQIHQMVDLTDSAVASIS